MTSSNCLYRVGDYVYFDVAHSTPYSIRRIEELIKNQSGNIEAKVLCFFRRRDISSSLISLADKHNIALEEEQELEAESLNEKQKHQLKHRELFFSRQIETLPATHIRGKCNVSLLNETESLSSYLNKEDSFFYTLVYEPNQKTLLADRGEIRVGQRYQAEIQKQLEQPTEDLNIAKKWETLIFKPNDLSSDEIERYITIVKSIGTFGRALDVSSTIKQSNLLLTASNASRDITIQKAMDILHENDYDIGKALLAFTPNNVPTICKDELEEWSPSEAALFEESLEKYGKSFNEIRREVLPWKRMKNIIEYYYMWKTTDRHVNPKRLKANDSETKLKQVYIPNNKQQMNNGIANGAISGDVPGKSCESCGKVNSTLWYSWGTAHSNDRLCQSCWTYWKKFGGLRYPNKLTVQEQEKLNSSSNTSLNNSTGNGSNGQNLNNSTKDSNKTNTNNLNNNSTNDEQYKCKECNKSFNRQERLTAHMVSHSSNFKCNFPNCGKEYRIKIHLARHYQQAHSQTQSGSPRPIMKTRAAFFVQANQSAKLARSKLSDLIKLKLLSKNPFLPINITQIKQEFQSKFSDNNLPKLPKFVGRKKGKINDVAHRLGIDKEQVHEWLKPLPKDQLPQPDRLAFPLPKKDKEGNFILPKQSDNSDLSTKLNNEIPNSKKRNYDQIDQKENSNLPHATLNRRALVAPVMMMNGNSNGKSRNLIARIGGKIYLNAPDDDIFFVANEATKKLRQQVQATMLKRTKRRPNLKIINLSLELSNKTTKND